MNHHPNPLPLSDSAHNEYHSGDPDCAWCVDDDPDCEYCHTTASETCPKCHRTTYWCQCHIVWVRNPNYTPPAPL